jgi:hypothetical protein
MCTLEREVCIVCTLEGEVCIVCTLEREVCIVCTLEREVSIVCTVIITFGARPKLWYGFLLPVSITCELLVQLKPTCIRLSSVVTDGYNALKVDNE